MSSPELTLVIPAFDEADVIVTTLRAMRRELPRLLADGGVELVVVDDGSTDDTADLSRPLADRVISVGRNRGKGHAVRTGVGVATGRVVAFCDADLAYGPAEVAAVTSAVAEGADAALGDRRHGAGDTGAGALRRLGGAAVAAAAGRLVAGGSVDTQCGLKAFSGPVARDVFARATVDGFAFDVEVIHLLGHLGYRYVQVPVTATNRPSSSVRLVRDGLTLARDIGRIGVRSRRGLYGPARPPGGVGAAS